MLNKKVDCFFCVVLSCMLGFVSCKKKEKNLVNNKFITTLFIDSSIFSHPIQIPVNHSSLRYVQLQYGRHNVVNHIDEIKINSNTIFILDRLESCLTLFNMTGKFIKSVVIKNSQLQHFDIYNNNLYVLDNGQNRISKFDLKANLIHTYNQGFHGVQFATLPDDKFVYNTGGLVTSDGDSEAHQLSIVNGSHISVLLPFKEIYKGVKYFFENQFSRDNDQLFFISAFDNVMYKIDTSKITGLTKFNFAKYNMPDSIFLKGQAYDSFNAFPYVSDLVNAVNTSRFSFFKFSFNSQQGYLISDAKRTKIIAGGISVAANEASDFNNVFPVCSYGDTLVSVVTPKIWIKMSTELDLSKTKLNNNYPLKKMRFDDGPILLFYTLL